MHMACQAHASSRWAMCGSEAEDKVSAHTINGKATAYAAGRTDLSAPCSFPAPALFDRSDGSASSPALLQTIAAADDDRQYLCCVKVILHWQATTWAV